MTDPEITYADEKETSSVSTDEKDSEEEKKKRDHTTR